jgi:hypothetical protein
MRIHFTFLRIFNTSGVTWSRRDSLKVAWHFSAWNTPFQGAFGQSTPGAEAVNARLGSGGAQVDVVN